MKLHCKESGSGESLIVIHGLLGMSDNWASHARKWSEQYRVITIDVRNHGRSPHDDEMNYDVMTEDLAEFMDTHNINDAHLLGHSMGGKLVMKFAQHYPYRVRKLIVADIAPAAYPVKHETILKALDSVPLDKLKKRGDADDYLARYIREIGIRQFLMKSLYRGKDNSYKWRFNLEAIKNNIEKIGEATMDMRYEGPVLFLRGGNSDYITDEHAEDISLIFPNNRTETVKNAGHWLHAEQPEDFSKRVMKFLGEK